ncbi:hypothetical protein GKZ68_11000 [Hymenobacter sp. BRD128]|uniref:hypothetical protein n=1 Tax=Hymenobacter sp. BRD128 TaxID=2675878 RepID=UPI0015989732|nr:hypothetical protein [Hymenobacter sp. BRD128]QKG57110.1 hypothetical protein GKZ68_11000 [Hymenobacter sp. BRD128]
MGYEVHITRKVPRWADEEDNATITLAEWLDYVASDSEMRLDEYPEWPVYLADGNINPESDGQSVWLPYSKNGVAGNYAWFCYFSDRVTVKNPDEEILGKMLAIARTLGARVQGDDGEYFDESSAYLADAHQGTIFEASTDFRDFQTFASAEAAQPLLAAIARQGILARTAFDNGQLAFDPSFANNQLTSKYIVKVQLSDFERASQVLAAMNAHALSQADPTHYLFSFTDEELFDLLVKPDEWSAYDVALAGQLLRQRGRDISPDTLRLLRQRRVAELAAPPQDHQALIVGSYLSALLGGFFGLLVGYQLYFNRRLLPDGRRVYSYSATDRVHGLRILVLGIVVFVLVLGLQIIRAADG